MRPPALILSVGFGVTRHWKTGKSHETWMYGILWLGAKYYSVEEGLIHSKVF